MSVRVQGGQVLAVAQRDLRDRHAAGRLERLAQEVVWLLAQLFRLHEICVLEVQPGLDVVDGDELLDVDRVGGGQGEVVQVLVVDDHVPILAYLVALEDLSVLDLVITLRAPALVRDGRLVVWAQLAERNLRGRLRRVVQANWNRDHPERDDAFPHRSRHGDAVYLPFRCLATFCWFMPRRLGAPSKVSTLRTL